MGNQCSTNQVVEDAVWKSLKIPFSDKQILVIFESRLDCALDAPVKNFLQYIVEASFEKENYTTLCRVNSTKLCGECIPASYSLLYMIEKYKTTEKEANLKVINAGAIKLVLNQFNSSQNRPFNFPSTIGGPHVINKVHVKDKDNDIDLYLGLDITTRQDDEKGIAMGVFIATSETQLIEILKKTYNATEIIPISCNGQINNSANFFEYCNCIHKGGLPNQKLCIRWKSRLYRVLILKRSLAKYIRSQNKRIFLHEIRGQYRYVGPEQHI